MLSLFPELLFLSPLAAFLIRISVAIMCALALYYQYQKRAELSPTLAMISFPVHALLAVFLAIGLYTQAAALVAALSALVGIFPPAIVRPFIVFPKSAIALFIIMAFTLVLTGPGPFAFDLPL